MNWLSNFIRPSIRSLVGEKKDVPDNLWQKCSACEGMLFHKELKSNDNVCYHCGHHMAIPVSKRLEILFDEGAYQTTSLPKVPHDPLKFKDRKKYAERLKETRQKTGSDDALIIAKGKIGGQNAVVAAFNFAFMGGSMGTAVGEGIVRAAEEAVKTRSALIVVPSSGGARMQEGMLSLMQMPRTIIAVDSVKEAGLPYIVLLVNPTTGGVSASFAMVGDIHIAEPGAMIGFAGRRVIEETVRETLPDDFQTAEYLLEHGMVDMVVPRAELNAKIGTILDLLMNKTSSGPKGGGSKVKSKDAGAKSTAKKDGPKKGKKVGPVSIKSADSVTKKPANSQKVAKAS
ncbi:MAG: acetyl-CoA carboxylase, carboxyltransferase subunit beta [Alphaproteobacteria bacterium]|nr:acetyl-CoA carboxylase, carboxyltransferase subunit beta [Alphaproteobacteria bacterium]